MSTSVTLLILYTTLLETTTARYLATDTVNRHPTTRTYQQRDHYRPLSRSSPYTRSHGPVRQTHASPLEQHPYLISSGRSGLAASGPNRNEPVSAYPDLGRTPLPVSGPSSSVIHDSNQHDPTLTSTGNLSSLDAAKRLYHSSKTRETTASSSLRRKTDTTKPISNIYMQALSSIYGKKTRQPDYQTSSQTVSITSSDPSYTGSTVVKSSTVTGTAPIVDTYAETQAAADETYVEKQPIVDTTYTETQPVVDTTYIEQTPIVDTTYTGTGTVVDTTYTGTQPVVDTTYTGTGPVVDTTYTGTGPVVDTTYTETGPVVDTTYTEKTPIVDTTYTETGPVVETTYTGTGPVVDTTYTATQPVVDTAYTGTGPSLDAAYPETGPVADTTYQGTGPIADTTYPGTGPVVDTAYQANVGSSDYVEPKVTIESTYTDSSPTGVRGTGPKAGPMDPQLGMPPSSGPMHPSVQPINPRLDMPSAPIGSKIPVIETIDHHIGLPRGPTDAVFEPIIPHIDSSLPPANPIDSQNGLQPVDQVPGINTPGSNPTVVAIDHARRPILTPIASPQISGPPDTPTPFAIPQPQTFVEVGGPFVGERIPTGQTGLDPLPVDSAFLGQPGPVETLPIVQGPRTLPLMNPLVPGSVSPHLPVMDRQPDSWVWGDTSVTGQLLNFRPL